MRTPTLKLTVILGYNCAKHTFPLLLQACEHKDEDPVPEQDWILFMFSDLRAQRLDITEESKVFSKNIAKGTEFHSTVYHLIKDMASEAAMETIKNTHYLFINTVFQLLFATRVLTYS